jgi:hypothetical protein
MTLSNMAFNPVTGLLDVATYPTKPANETAARQQFMDLFYALRDYNNNSVVPEVNGKFNSTGGTVTGQVKVSQTTDVVDQHIDGVATSVLQTLYGTIGSLLASIGTRFSGADLVITHNAYQDQNADHWVQGSASYKSIQIRMKLNDGIYYYEAAAGKAPGTDASFWGTGYKIPYILSGGYKVQSGTIAAASTGSFVVTFPTAFSTVPVVVGTYQTNGTSNSVVVRFYAVSTTSVTFYTEGISGGAINWIAIAS